MCQVLTGRIQPVGWPHAQEQTLLVASVCFVTYPSKKQQHLHAFCRWRAPIPCFLARSTPLPAYSLLAHACLLCPGAMTKNDSFYPLTPGCTLCVRLRLSCRCMRPCMRSRGYAICSRGVVQPACSRIVSGQGYFSLSKKRVTKECTTAGLHFRIICSTSRACNYIFIAALATIRCAACSGDARFWRMLNILCQPRHTMLCQVGR